MKSILSRLFKKAATTVSGNRLTGQIERARALHQDGKLDAAGTLYRQIIETHPNGAEAHYRYGNVLKDQEKLEDALEYYDRAVALKPDHAHAICNRAVVLGLMHRVPDALASYDRALSIDPADVIAHCNRAILLRGLGQTDAALAGFENAIVHEPKCFPAHFGRAAVLQERRQWGPALAAYDRAIASNPDDALTHYNHGTVLRELSQLHAALASYGRAIALNSEFLPAYANRGELLHELNQFTAALESFDRAIAINNRDANTHNSRAVLLQKMGRFNAALAGYDQALALKPDYAEAHFNRGSVLEKLDQLDAAVDSYGRAIAVRHRYEDAYVNRGVALQNLGRLQEAIANYRQAIHINPDHPEAHYNLALALLTIGDFAAGWNAYEWRWCAKGGPIFREKRDFGSPLWIGQAPIADRTILLYGEQGLGDSLQFCRYVPMVAGQGARVILELPAPLVSLCSTLAGVAQVIPYGSSLPEFDCQCPLMSLPLAFQTTLDTIPAASRYVSSDTAKVAAWRLRIGARTKPRIGLTWSGMQTAGTSRKRHFPLSGLTPHLSKDFDYFCLQTDIAAADQEVLAENPWIFQFGHALGDFSDTAALCECMDLVISVDTSVAHLSGALGLKTWVLLAFNADWRWLIDREDSPWYRTARLFRQKSPGDWHGVFERVASALRVEFDGCLSGVAAET